MIFSVVSNHMSKAILGVKGLFHLTVHPEEKSVKELKNRSLEAGTERESIQKVTN